MSEVLIPTWIIPEEEQQEPLDEGSGVFGAAFAPGVAQRQSYGGLRLKLSRLHKSVRLEEKAQLLSILRSTRGRYNTLRSKVHFALRGSFPATELLTNPTFASGTVGWTAGSDAVLSVADRVMRLQAGAANNASMSQIVSGAVQYAPYALRAMIMEGAQSAGISFSALMDDGLTGVQASSATRGLLTASGINYSSSTLTHYPALFSVASGFTAGAYVSVPYTSLSRVALIDNGSNALLRSDEFDNAVWTKSELTIAANAVAAPTGATIADNLTETTANSVHEARQDVTVAAAAADFCFAIAVKAQNRAFCQLNLAELTGSTELLAYFDIINGTVGTTGIGANWGSLRTAVQDLGGGWRYLCIIGRKTNAATSIRVTLRVATADGTASYTGSAASVALSAWRGTFAQSSVPARLVETTSAATAGTSQTGSALHLKGLPASTNGLLLPDDVFEINGELKTCTAALNSDAAGLGYLQFEPALFRSPADNDPVIILDPMGKFLMSNLKIDNEFGTQAKVSYDLEHIYE